MSAMQPHSQLTGVLKVYLAIYGETEPNINSVPGANWVELGPTDGEQSIELAGPLTHFYDNNHISAVKGTRPQEDQMVNFSVVGLTLENIARIKSTAAAVVATTMNGATVKRLPAKMGYTPTEYALLLKGDADSPYGVLPGQHYVPRGVFEGEHTLTRAKDGRPQVDCVFHKYEDDAQAAGSELGWDTVQY